MEWEPGLLLPSPWQPPAAQLGVQPVQIPAAGKVFPWGAGCVPSPSLTWEAEWQQEERSQLHGRPQAQGMRNAGGCPTCAVQE